MIKSILSACLLILFVLPASGQTVVIDFGPISGAIGETVLVPVDLSGVESTDGFNSFSFSVNVTGSNLVYNEGQNSRTGTLGASTGWNVVSNNGKVAGFASSSNAITTSGTLINLSVTIQAEGSGTIELTDFTLKKNNAQGVAEDVPFSPAVPSATLSVSNAPEASDDSYSVNEGGTLTVLAAQGVLANDTDADGDALTATVATNVSNGTLTLNANGSFIYTHNGSETTSDSFTYTVSDGADTDIGLVAITINPVNDAPVFTSFMEDVEVNQGGTVIGDFTATDGENDLLTYSLVSGPSGIVLDATTGDFVWAATETGDFQVVVAVSDGTVSVNAPTFTISVRAVESFYGELSGMNSTTLVSGSASGFISATFIPDDNELVINGEFSGIGSLHAVSQVGIGAFLEAGSSVTALTPAFPNGDASARSATFNNNTIDLTSLTYPSGETMATFVAALRSGDVFVSVRTVDNLEGELRAQLAPDDNTPPTSLDVMVPTSASATGDPSDELYSATWAGQASDQDGDATRLVLQVAADAGFGEILSSWDVSVTPNGTVAVTVDEAAQLVDRIIGATQLGGSADAHYRLVTTDGAALSSGTASSITLVRGTVTNTDEDASVPEQFLLRGNYPNPFNPTTNIEFDLPEAADVEVRVLDLLGRTMLTVPSQPLNAGTNQRIRIDAEDLASGIYIYRVLVTSAERSHVATGTMTLIK
jgi:VCBS repeat-containing protein